MLIKCKRHTGNDLEKAKTYSQIDELRDIRESLVVTAIEQIKQSTKSYLSISWGKDSTVLLSVALMCGYTGPVIWVKESPFYNPECELVRDWFLEKYPIKYHEMVLDYGKYQKGQRGKDCLFYSFSDILSTRFGVRISGIRNDESNTRLLRYLSNGFSTKKTLAPLSLWKSADIFAYIEQNNLPLHPVYGMLGGGRYDRKYLRVDCIGGIEGNGIGRLEWEKEYYPDVLRRSGYVYC
jgi:phosphoadenosine phosphosulfate reductase